MNSIAELPLSIQISKKLEDDIIYGFYLPGTKLDEQELCERYGASRTPIREALSRLQRDGLVKVIPRHGMRVLPISLTDIQEIYQILTSLESLAVELAAARKLTAKELEFLERATQKMNVAHEASDIKTWAQADEDFHYHLVELAGNRILTDVAGSFWSRAQRARLTLLSRRKSTAESTLEHAKLVDAIRQGDSRLARETLENHRRRGIQNLTELMAQEQNVLRLL